MPAEQAKDHLLSRVVDHALGHGIADLSLRQVANAIGTSHRMLIYHFGSREGLLVAVVREVERRERAALVEADLSPGHARERWDHLAHPSMWAQERLFFEIYAQALLGRPGTEGFLDDAVPAWIDPIVDVLTAAGAAEADARVVARLGLAVTRGLLLDLLATGDHAGTTESFELFMTLLESMTTTRTVPPATAAPAARATTRQRPKGTSKR